MANNPRNVRQKTGEEETSLIPQLPDGFLVNVSEYLPKPSKAMLAVALSAPSSSWNSTSIPSDVSRAIVSASQWDTLDFEDINKELAKKLIDDDISAVLKSINAHDMLKRLKLCGCTNIEGHGLNLLRGSVVLEQIDFSLVRKHESRTSIESKLSREVILPILDSIVSSEGCSLRYITFNGGREFSDSRQSIQQFRERYNGMFTRRSNSLCCSHCNTNMRNHQNWIGNSWMLHNYICYDCLKPFCRGCADVGGDGNGTLNFCSSCSNDYCQDCIATTSCASCSSKLCKGCGNMEVCDKCENATCDGCLNTCGGCARTRCKDCVSYHRCEGRDCEKAHCEDCYDDEEYDVFRCDDEDCLKYFCNSCRLADTKLGVTCNRCAAAVVPMLFHENAKLTEEVEELAKDNQELREKVESMSL